MTPLRGEVWLVDLGMAAKVRPALVISIPAEDIDRAGDRLGGLSGRPAI